MSTPANFFRFVLLKTAPPNNVLYYDSKIPFDALFESVEYHLFSVYNLLALLPELKDDSLCSLPAAAVVSSWLSDDINTQLHKFNTTVLLLKEEGK